jgi:hypothetical protein
VKLVRIQDGYTRDFERGHGIAILKLQESRAVKGWAEVVKEEPKEEEIPEEEPKQETTNEADPIANDGTTRDTKPSKKRRK